MNTASKPLLIIWTLGLIAIGSVIGSLTTPEISTWYSTLHGICGWLIWRASVFPKLSIIKTLYVTQLILHWSWTPLFFHYNLTGLSLIVLGLMDILVGAIILLAYRKIKAVSLLMLPHLFSILFASYLILHMVV
jgi:benzodiazapine receptor